MFRKFTLSAFVLIAAALSATTASAQTEDREQSYNVTYPTILSLVAPADPGTLTHDGTAGNKAFATQSWTCASNNAGGVTVTLTATAFGHATVGTSNADVALTLANTGVFNPTTANASTSGGSGTAQVVGASTGAGSGTFELTVEFVTPADLSTLVAGSYTSTVTGTIVAN